MKTAQEMLSKTVDLFVVYDHPSDFPHSFVVRKHTVAKGTTVVSGLPFLVGPDLEAIREVLRRAGATNIGRQPDDDPVIVEVWL